MWAEILLQNRSQIVDPLRNAALTLSKMAEDLTKQDRAEVLRVLTDGRIRRETLDRAEQ